MMNKKLAVIGAGKIGTAILRGVIKAGVFGKDQIMASDVSEALRQSAASELAIKVTPDNKAACAFADIVLLAVKPQILDAVVKEIAGAIGTAKLVVSVAAGVAI